MITYTVRPVLWTYGQPAGGIYTVKICVTIKGRSPFYILTPYRAKVDQWVALELVGSVDAKLKNADIRKRIADIEARFIQCSLENTKVTKAILEGKAEGKDRPFIPYSLEVRKSKKETNRLIKFAGEDFRISDVDVAFLRRYDKHEKDRGMSQNTRNGTFKFLRRILRQAKGEKLIKENPLEFFLVPKYVDPERFWLVKEARAVLLGLLKRRIDPSLRTTLIYFLLSCYTGYRYSDWKPNIQVYDNKIRLRTTKAKTDVVMPVGPTLRRIIALTQGLRRPFSNKESNMHLKIIFGPGMAAINQKGNCHLGRHTFGYICASNRLPKSVTAELMGISVKTVEVYYHLSGENITQQAAILGKI